MNWAICFTRCRRATFSAAPGGQLGLGFTLDRAGHVVSRREGYQSTRVLEAMLLDASARVPAEAVEQPPLMGTTSTQR